MTQLEGERYGRVAMPSGAQVRVIEDTDEIVHLVLPMRPDALSKEQLDQIAAGSTSKESWPDPQRKLSR